MLVRPVRSTAVRRAFSSKRPPRNLLCGRSVRCCDGSSRSSCWRGWASVSVSRCFVLPGRRTRRGAGAVRLVAAEREAAAGQWQAWANASLVPTVTGQVTCQAHRVSRAAEGGGVRVHASSRGSIYIKRGLTHPRGVMLHELGHVYDLTVLSNRDRGEFRRIMRRPHSQWWKGKVPLAEWFAEAYAWCARYSKIVSVDRVRDLRLRPDADAAPCDVRADQARGAGRDAAEAAARAAGGDRRPRAARRAAASRRSSCPATRCATRARRVLESPRRRRRRRATPRADAHADPDAARRRPRPPRPRRRRLRPDGHARADRRPPTPTPTATDEPGADADRDARGDRDADAGPDRGADAHARPAAPLTPGII